MLDIIVTLERLHNTTQTLLIVFIPIRIEFVSVVLPVLIRCEMLLFQQDITNLIQTFVNGDAVDDAWTSVKELVDRQSEIIGFPEVGPLRQFTQRACESGMQVEALVRPLFLFIFQ